MHAWGETPPPPDLAARPAWGQALPEPSTSSITRSLGGSSRNVPEPQGGNAQALEGGGSKLSNKGSQFGPGSTAGSKFSMGTYSNAGHNPMGASVFMNSKSRVRRARCSHTRSPAQPTRPFPSPARRTLTFHYNASLLQLPTSGYENGTGSPQKNFSYGNPSHALAPRDDILSNRRVAPVLSLHPLPPVCS
jgi:hypothetical protein